MTPELFKKRRRALVERLGSDRPILLLGNGERSRNLPMNKLPFRQDSSFLYLTGCRVPDAALLLDGNTETLYLPTPAPDDALWHGETLPPEAYAAASGISHVADVSTLTSQPEARVLAVGDEQKNMLGSSLSGQSLRFGRDFGDAELVDALIALRRTKSAEELAEMRTAALHTEAAFRCVMAATHVGGHERVLAALFQAVLGARDCALGYSTILSQRGEVLHNHDHDSPLEAGRLLLLDGGGEVASGYTADVTRTWPVSGAFTGRQRAAYDAVLAAQKASIALCRAGVPYRAVHDAASLVIAQFLADEGLLRTSPQVAVETGAHALFFPHGIGHLIGLDVHDLENFGDRPAYPAGLERPDQFGTCYLRLQLDLEPDWVVTIEPGFYVVPAILNDQTLRARFRSQVDFDKAAQWVGFGGIRIEDDVRITEETPEVLTDTIPKEVSAIEALVGSGTPAEDLLGLTG